MPVFLNNEQQERCITPLEAVEALERGLGQFARGEAIRRPRIDNILPTSRENEWFCFGTMEGGIRDPGIYALRVKPDIYRLGGERLISYSYKPGLYGGMVFLYSTDNAEFLAMMNDGFVHHLRVAASAALGVKYLSRPESSVLGIIGSGGMARFFAQTISAVRPIKRIQVWSPTKANLNAYVKEMQPKVAAEIVPVKSAEAVARGADILCACTTATSPPIEAEWIEPGMHLNHVTHYEISKEVIERVDTVGILVRRTPMKVSGFVDDDFCTHTQALTYLGGRPEERARFQAFGKPNPDRYAGKRIVDCVDWNTGTPYRRDPKEVTLLANASYGILEGEALVSAGTQGIQFASVGGRIYLNARQRGIGTEIPREMFLQDIPT